MVAPPDSSRGWARPARNATVDRVRAGRAQPRGKSGGATIRERAADTQRADRSDRRGDGEAYDESAEEEREIHYSNLSGLNAVMSISFCLPNAICDTSFPLIGPSDIPSMA